LITPSGKTEDAVATVGGFSGEAEAFPETGKLRKREDVEQRDDQEIVEAPEPAFGEEPLAGRVAEFAQVFAAHGGGEAMAEAGRKREEDQTDVGAARGVVGDEECRAVERFEIFTADDFGVAEDQRGRPR